MRVYFLEMGVQKKKSSLYIIQIFVLILLNLLNVSKTKYTVVIHHPTTLGTYTISNQSNRVTFEAGRQHLK